MSQARKECVTNVWQKRKVWNTSHTSPFSCFLWVTSEWMNIAPPPQGAGIAQWLEHRTRDWKVAGSNPCWNGGRIFFSRVDFLCWLLFRYPFHPRVTTVARKKSRSFCQKCRWQVTAKHAYTLRMWIYWTVLRHWSQLVPNMSWHLRTLSINSSSLPPPPLPPTPFHPPPPPHPRRV